MHDLRVSRHLSSGGTKAARARHGNIYKPNNLRYGGVLASILHSARASWVSASVNSTTPIVDGGALRKKQASS